jgi:large subunit ribosomal protein L30
MSKKTKITLVRSTNRRTEQHKACVRGLGLGRINSSVEVDVSNPCIKGMVDRVRYLLKVEEA